MILTLQDLKQWNCVQQDTRLYDSLH